MMQMYVELIERGGRKPILPQYQTAGAAAFDLAAFLDAAVTLPAGGRALIPTGLRIAVPAGYAGLVLARSGLASRHGVAMSNGVGLIDSDYRGELCVALQNSGDMPFTVRDGDRIAQFLLAETPSIELCVVSGLDDTTRGCRGFGSTGTGAKEC
ncbi:MAG: dUTP diphosphatase [Clostridiaceae bacterium]|nr:dUTP diphosphatase [Clostridiaceae bacterium]